LSEHSGIPVFVAMCLNINVRCQVDVIEVLDKHLVGFYLRQNVEGPLTIGEDDIKPRREVLGLARELAGRDDGHLLDVPFLRRRLAYCCTSGLPTAVFGP
jgi:hypothetical protein